MMILTAESERPPQMPPAMPADSTAPAEPPFPAAAGGLDDLVEELIRAVRRTLSARRRPRATYRLQFHRGFTFRDATALVPYFDSLGVSDVYASPYLKTVAGSLHGYDTVDHSRLNPDLGTEDDFHAFTAALRERGMGHILDFVPNHMGVATDENVWWQDVLENGPGSKYAAYFDIDWSPLKPDLTYKVLLPVLGEQFGQVLESGQLQLDFQDGAFFVTYFQRRFPLAPKTFATVLRHRLEELVAKLPADAAELSEYQSILTALAHLPERTESDPAKLEERNREKEVIKRRLARLCEESPAIRDWIRENVAIFNGRGGEPRSFDLLDKLLDEQSYRLSFWRVAADEINYRRFFDVNELAAVCMERPEVFEAAHAFVFSLIESGELEGLRIDHADGLYDPTAYLWQLQERRFLQLCAAELTKRSPPDSQPHPWPEVAAALKEHFQAIRASEGRSEVLTPLYLVVEKILEPAERLPANWPIHGSTGYDFVHDVNGIFVEEANAKAFDAIYAKFIGTKTIFAELVYEAKRLILRSAMSSELVMLGHQLDRLSEKNRWTRDFTLHGLIQALREVIACFPVYRTYTVGEGVLDRDRRYVTQAVARAKRRNPEMSEQIFLFVRDVLLLAGLESLSPEERAQRQAFVGRFQQFTGPTMAKAVEDTAYYRYARLVSLNEVGGDPQRFGTSLTEFHDQNRERQAQRPLGLLATSTHDTKRAEDVRARLNVLSELPEEWKHCVARWTRWNKRKKAKLEGDLAPTRNDEYLLYQTLVGTWPFHPPRGEELKTYIGRIQQYMTKAVREAKSVSSWIAPNEAYERSLHGFIEAILADEPQSAFRKDFEPFAARVAASGIWNSIAQTLLKLTSPGVPDIYQGTELWDFSLVDPDNRRPVDFEARKGALAEIESRLGDRAALAGDLLAARQDGRIKLYVHAVALELRRRVPAFFTTGEYLPLQTIGPREDRLCAFARRTDDEAALVVVPRLVAELLPELGAPPIGAEVWHDTAVVLPPALADRRWTNLFTGEVIPAGPKLAAGELLRTFPIALLETTAAEAPSSFVSGHSELPR